MFFKYRRMENLNSNNENIERKYLNNMRKNQGKEWPFRIRKRFYRIERQRIKR